MEVVLWHEAMGHASARACVDGLVRVRVVPDFVDRELSCSRGVFRCIKQVVQLLHGPGCQISNDKIVVWAGVSLVK